MHVLPLTPRHRLFSSSIRCLLCFATISIAQVVCGEEGGIEARWDVTATGTDGSYPSWFEVERSGPVTLTGRYVGRFGSARPVSRFEFKNGVLRFVVPPQFEKREDDQVFEAEWKDGKLFGETTDEQGKPVKWIAVRAPKLDRAKEPKWGTAIELFNGKDLTGWKSRMAGKEHGWVVTDGLLDNAKPGVDLVSEEKFADFKVHAEFRYPKGSNSGLYLRGRYEVQIEDNYGGEANSHRIGGVYGFLTPRVNAAKPANEWQTVDVALVGREVSVTLNGEPVIERQAIPGITGGALDSNEGEPGPIMIQGDHGIVQFRKITVTKAVE